MEQQGKCAGPHARTQDDSDVKWLRMLVLAYAVGTAIGQLRAADVQVTVTNERAEPVPGVRVSITYTGQVVVAGETDASGRLVLPGLKPGLYELSASKNGFETLRRTNLDLTSPGAIELTLTGSLAVHSRVDVEAQATPLDHAAPAATPVEGKTAKEVLRPSTVADALPLSPGVVRTPAGDLELSGQGEHRSALIVNSADVTDPATGQFGLTVPIDSVATFSFFQTPFLAEYGRFTAGLVSVETRRGGEAWKWEINDPFPDFRIRSWHMRGVRDATPRLNVEGPLIHNKLYFSEGLEYEIRNIEIHTLAFPFNQKRKQGVNSFAQLDWIASSRHLVTATAHVAPQRLSYATLDYFTPQPSTPDAGIRNYTGSIGDHFSLWGGMLDNTLSLTRFRAREWGRGTDDFIFTPYGNRGSYFAQQNGEAERYMWRPSYALPPIGALGNHAFKFGAYLARSNDTGEMQERPVQIVDQYGRTLERINFLFGRPFHMQDTEKAFFGQDHWSISSRLAADLGVRTESQVLSHSFRVAPRIGLAWLPFSGPGTVIRAGVGAFYDRVPLNVYSFSHYPKQFVTYYDENGDPSGPFFFLNSIGVARTRPPFVFRKQVEGNFSPRSTTGSIQLEQTVSSSLKLRVSYIENHSGGLVVMDVHAPDPDTKVGAHELSGDGDARYRQFEVMARFHPSAKHDVFFSYVRSQTVGDINDFSTYLGTFPLAIIRPNAFGRLAGDIPNRFLSWGMFQFPAGFSIAPIFEYRNGFPYSTVDAAQNYVGQPNAQRYRNFLSLDSRFSRDFKVNPKYSVRLSVAAYNLTNHFNPDAFHANIADPSYGVFFGGRARRFTADFDVLF